MKCPIWTYWEGSRPWWIDLCLDSMRAVYGSNRFTVVEPETLGDYVDPGLIHPNCFKLDDPAVRSCVVRAALIYQHGGWWVDADTVAVSRFGREIPNRINYVTWSGRHRVVNAYFGAPPSDPTVKCWLEFINHVLQYRFHEIGAWWTVMGEPLITAAVLLEGGRKLPRETWLPYDFDLYGPQRFLEEGTIRQYITKGTNGFGLNGSWLRANASDELAINPNRLANSPLLIHSILSYAKSMIDGSRKRPR